MLLERIKHLINMLCFPLCRRIVFESNPEMSGNVGAVYNELLKRGINKKYKLVLGGRRLLSLPSVARRRQSFISRLG